MFYFSRGLQSFFNQKKNWEAVRSRDGDKLLKVLVNSRSPVIFSEGWCHFTVGPIRDFNTYLFVFII